MSYLNALKISESRQSNDRIQLLRSRNLPKCIQAWNMFVSPVYSQLRINNLYLLFSLFSYLYFSSLVCTIIHQSFRLLPKQLWTLQFYKDARKAHKRRLNILNFWNKSWSKMWCVVLSIDCWIFRLKGGHYSKVNAVAFRSPNIALLIISLNKKHLKRLIRKYFLKVHFPFPDNQLLWWPDHENRIVESILNNPYNLNSSSISFDISKGSNLLARLYVIWIHRFHFMKVFAIL